jgi:DNA (cytosine-5)-methyltransferase 1
MTGSNKPCPTCSGVGVLEATDMFCGAGGSSLGLEAVCCRTCGRSLIKITQAINHWPLAVEAHNANFPDADHDVHDVEVIPASRFRTTDLLWASPECTHHAYCRGPRDDDPEADRSRATFNDVVRFTEYHHYSAVMVENVIEARLWCDVPSHGERCSCGAAFDEWYESMLNLGYHGKIVYFNSQFALPTPQSRDRMYVIFWRDGLPAPQIDYRPESWCGHCETVVRGKQTWKTPTRGSARDNPGLYEYGRYGLQYDYVCPKCRNNVAPAVVGARAIIDWSLEAQRIGDRPKDLAMKTRERIRHGIMKQATTDPIAVQVGGHLFERRPGVRVWSINSPLRTVHGTAQMALVSPGKSFVVANRENNVATDTAAPFGTVTTAPAQHCLIQVNRGDKGGTKDRSQALDEPTRTVAGHGEFAIVEMRNHGTAHPIDTPAATVCGAGNHHGLLSSPDGLLVYNGVPGFVRSLDDSTGTLTARDKQSLLVPYYSTGVAHPIGEPTSTVSTKDREALVVTEADVDDCTFRMLQWHELLRAQAPHDHVDGRPYVLTADQKDPRTGRMKALTNENRVKLIGNMVSSPVATMWGAAIVEVLAA